MVNTHLNASSATDLTFFLYDAGETKALEPVIEALKRAQKTYKIIAVGTADQLLRDTPQKIDLKTACGVEATITAEAWKRDQILSDSDLEKLKNCTKASVLVTGYNSALQTQLVAAFKGSKTQTVVFYDSFNPPATCSDTDRSPCFAENAALAADVVLTSTYGLRDAFQRITPARCFTLGNPTLESWQKDMESVDKTNLYASLNLSPQKPLILYMGGYGEDYESSFGLFLDSVKNLTPYQIVIALHPKVDGAFEEKLAREKNLPFVTIAPKTIPVSSLATLATLGVTQRSTTGVQARFAGLPVIYLDTHPQKYTNFLITAKQVAQLSSPEDFIDELAVIEKRNKDAQPLSQQMGVPLGAAQKIAHYLIGLTARGKGKEAS
jgi:hypothetical protein